MPLATISFQQAHLNLKREPLSLWPDGRRLRGQRLEGVVQVAGAPTFKLRPGEPIFTIGSCFARNIERRLIALGFTVATRGHDLGKIDAKEDQILNIYNAPAMLNEIRWGIDPAASFPRRGLIEVEDGVWHDLHLFQDAPDGRRKALLRRRAAMKALYARITTCRVVILTLGLSEAWFDTSTRLYLNGPPPISAGQRQPDRFQLHVLTAKETLACLEKIHALLSRFGRPDFRLLVTVSPVPFKATFRGQDALSANMYSKSALRAGVEEFTALHGNVDYFPSYEIATLTDRAAAYNQDNIHVANEIVDSIMDSVLRGYAPELFTEAPKTQGLPNPSEMARRARAASDSGDFTGTVKWLRILLRHGGPADGDMDASEFDYLYGRALSETRRPMEGEPYLRRAYLANRHSAEHCYEMGAVRSRLGRTTDAEFLFRRAVRLDPLTVKYRVRYAAVLIALGRSTEAGAHLDAVLAEHPDNATAVALKKLLPGAPVDKAPSEIETT